VNKLLVWNFSQLEGEKSNTGDKAIFFSMVTDIKKAMPNAEIITISNDPQYTAKQYGVRAAHLWKITQICRALRQANLVILGGGEFIQDKTSIPYLLLNLSLGILAILFKKPIMFYAIGVGDNDEISTFGNFLSRFVLNQAKLISVRDEESKKVLESLGVKRPIYVTADPAFTLTPARKERLNEILTLEGVSKDKAFLIGVAPRKAPHGRFNVFPLGIQIRLNLAPYAYYIQNQKLGCTLAKTLDYFIDKLNAKVVFVPMYTGTNFSYRDHEFAHEIVNMMRNKNSATIVSGIYPPEELQAVFGEMDMIIGMTLHSLILAVTMNVPIVAISYSSKINRFMRAIGQEDQLIDIWDVKFEDLLRKFETTWASRLQIKQDLKASREILRKRALLNTKLIVNQ